MMQTISEDVRKTAAVAWLDTFKDRYGLAPETLEPASSDAGFRRYFRVTGSAGKTFIVMDAPTDKMNSEPFVRIDGLMKAAGLNVPEIYEQNLGEGFLLLSDLGRQTYLDVLNEDNAARLFDLATTELVKWQQATRPGVLPEYDHALLERELKLFPEWYVSRHKGFKMTEKQQALVNVVFERIMANNLAEAKVFVHRDFMPRNLMVTDGVPGILDFQDAVMGPVSYDIASLMRDAFVSWGEEFVLDVTIRYWDKARRAGIPVPRDFGVYWRDIEWMGLQRHLKILGIFARLNYRDGKPKYLADTPRFIHYVRQTANRYDELKAINWLLDCFEDSSTQEAYF